RDGHAISHGPPAAGRVLHWNSRIDRVGLGNERFGERFGIGTCDGDRATLWIECNAAVWSSRLRGGDHGRGVAPAQSLSEFILTAARDASLFHGIPGRS